MLWAILPWCLNWAFIGNKRGLLRPHLCIIVFYGPAAANLLYVKFCSRLNVSA